MKWFKSLKKARKFYAIKSKKDKSSNNDLVTIEGYDGCYVKENGKNVFVSSGINCSPSKFKRTEAIKILEKDVGKDWKKSFGLFK